MPTSGLTVNVISRTPIAEVQFKSTDELIEQDQHNALAAIRSFLKGKTAYDVLPVSFRLIVLDTSLLVRKSLNILIQNSIVSAPLWNSKTSKFAGLLTSSDYINVIQYYYQNPEKMDKIDHFTLDGLRDVEKAIGVKPIESVSVPPFTSLYDACLCMIASKGRRIPLIDYDDETQREIVVSVLTQYRILKFISQNSKETRMLRKPLKDLKIGVYDNLATATVDTPVIDVIHMLASRDVSSIPIVDKDGVLYNVYEAVDVLTLIKGGMYNDLKLTVGEALLKRSNEFEGVYTCTDGDRLDAIMDTIRRARLHRLVVVDQRGRLKGMVTLGDILQFLLLDEPKIPNVADIIKSDTAQTFVGSTTSPATESVHESAADLASHSENGTQTS
ncbi:uncharacterized protein V1516DRAFT_617804 [Lipomyces oligophaga]|uniref:uncharacterized protein n=1 Tax=Lipomyces oligophaga TaxID=45792 RepID=UPI0034CF0DDF